MLGFPGAVVRLSPGANPPETALAEVYEPPFNNPKAPIQGFSPRGMDVDRNGVVWAALASGHLASFDRRKCKGPLNGPTATGQHCPEGWTLYPEPLPQMKGVTDAGSAEGSYYTWVDQFDTFGLGANTPINTGNASEGLLALKDGKWVVLRVPYPTRLLHEVAGRPHRRSQGGMEGPGPLGDHQHARAVPHGDGQGHDEQGDQVPAAAGSAGEVGRGSRRTVRGSRDADRGSRGSHRRGDADRADHADHVADGTRMTRITSFGSGRSDWSAGVSPHRARSPGHEDGIRFTSVTALVPFLWISRGVTC